MQIKTITVHAGRVFNHPYEQFSNLRPGITMEAVLAPEDDPIAAAKALQQQAETLVEDHKRTMLESIHELRALTEEQAELRKLGDEMSRVQKRMDQIRAKHPELPSPPPPTDQDLPRAGSVDDVGFLKFRQGISERKVMPTD